MEASFKWGESKARSSETGKSWDDIDGNTPLYYAVLGGDIKKVKLCLKSGAKISTQGYDLSTPVHLACAKGTLETLKLMFSMQPTEKLACLKSCDVQKKTPIHCAAMFDRSDIVKYLIKEGSDINPLDEERKSPLLLAASKASWKTVHTLIRLGANIKLKDHVFRNLIHLVVMNGGKLEEFTTACQNRSAQTLAQLLDDQDSFGSTPVHYAVREGRIRSLETLIKLGANTNSTNKNNESPLDLAARYGRYHSARQLLDSSNGQFIGGGDRKKGQTPLHIASSEGHTNVVKLLLERGAVPKRNHNGRNPLHLAAMSGYTETIKLLHYVHPHLLDQIDKYGNTPLHVAAIKNQPNSIALLLTMGCRFKFNYLDMSALDYAINYEFPEAALAMVTHEHRAKEVMALRSDYHPCVTTALIAYLPQVFRILEDKCITKPKSKKGLCIKYSFDALSPTNRQESGNAPKSQDIPLPALNAMVAYDRDELLAHPLSQKYLQMKWHSYGKYYHQTNLLFYCVFMIFVMVYTYIMMMKNSTAVSVVTKPTKYNVTEYENETEKSIVFTPLDFESQVPMYTSTAAILVYICIFLLREASNLKEQKYRNFGDGSSKLVPWMLYINSSLMVFPTLFNCFEENQFAAALITVFLSWFELLLQLQRLDQLGIYFVMLVEILKALIKVSLVLMVLIIMGCCLLIKGRHLFNNMLSFPMAIFYIFVLIVILTPILLMNLLIGWIIGDFQNMKRNALKKKMAMQVVLCTELERKLPATLLENVNKNELLEYPNNKQCKLGFLDLILRK